jgi:hypothetical protein
MKTGGAPVSAAAGRTRRRRRTRMGNLSGMRRSDCISDQIIEEKCVEAKVTCQQSPGSERARKAQVSPLRCIVIPGRVDGKEGLH